MRGLSEYVKIVEEIHFTHIRRRMIKPSMEICFGGFGDNNDSKEPITLIVDASGRNKKDFVKLHIAVDARSKKVVTFRITKGTVHDSKSFVL